MRQYLYISIVCFVISAWLLSILLLGCVPPFNPRSDCLQAIEDAPYVSGSYNCQSKSKDAYKCLRENGYDACVVCGLVKGLERYHCWIEINHESEIYWYDPTWVASDPRYGCWKKSQWVDRKVVRHEYSGMIKPID